MQHPNVALGKQNQDYAINHMTSALQTIARLADGEDPDNIMSSLNTGIETTGDTAIHFDDFEVHCVVAC